MFDREFRIVPGEQTNVSKKDDKEDYYLERHIKAVWLSMHISAKLFEEYKDKDWNVLSLGNDEMKGYNSFIKDSDHNIETSVICTDIDKEEGYSSILISPKIAMNNNKIYDISIYDKEGNITYAFDKNKDDFISITMNNSAMGIVSNTANSISDTFEKEYDKYNNK